MSGKDVQKLTVAPIKRISGEVQCIGHYLYMVNMAELCFLDHLARQQIIDQSRALAQRFEPRNNHSQECVRKC